MAKALGLKLEVPTSPKVIKAFGEKPMVALWAEDKDLEHFAQWKIGDPDTFSALVMASRAPTNGNYFKADWLHEYEADDLPARSRLEVYGASDHAVGEKQVNDYSVIGCVGVDDKARPMGFARSGVGPDADRRDGRRDHRVDAAQQALLLVDGVRADLEVVRAVPGEEMERNRVYVPIDEVVPSKDKRTRARANPGLHEPRQGAVPAFRPVWQDAKSQLLKFPASGETTTSSDWMAHIGMGLMKQIAPPSVTPQDDNVIRTGSIQWILAPDQTAGGAA